MYCVCCPKFFSLFITNGVTDEGVGTVNTGGNEQQIQVDEYSIQWGGIVNSGGQTVNTGWMDWTGLSIQVEWTVTSVGGIVNTVGRNSHYMGGGLEHEQINFYPHETNPKIETVVWFHFQF